MRKNTESMMKGAALGLLAGGAVGAAGAYVAQKNPKEEKDDEKGGRQRGAGDGNHRPRAEQATERLKHSAKPGRGACCCPVLYYVEILP